MNQPSTSPTLFAALTRRPSKDAREAQQAAAKAARRQVLELVRNDWSYEPLSSPSELQSAAASRPDLECDVVEWRARDCETSGSETETAKIKPSSSSAGDKSDPYRFETPDVVAHGAIDIDRVRRRRKRLQVEEEMEWNEGLRLWMSRRDAWTGAKPATLEPVGTSDESAATSPIDDESAEIAKTPSQDSTTQNQSVVYPQNMPSVEIPEETLVPVVHPNSLYGNHARSPVTPNAYSTIYSRLILQSNAPTVPLNLMHVTRALVHGWKASGEWPPKPTPRNDVPVRRRGATSTAAGRSEATRGNTEVSGSRKTGRSGSLGETMKKMFHLRPGRRFHLRTTSKDDEGPAPEA